MKEELPEDVEREIDAQVIATALSDEAAGYVREQFERVAHIALRHRESEVEEQRSKKDGAYEERNRLVAYLASIFPSALCKTDIEGWNPEWHWCCYVMTPQGQMSWHVHESQLGLFDHVERKQWAWDGHTTEEKYRRLDALRASRPTEEPTE